MPSWNSTGNVRMTSWGRPIARSPSAVMSDVHGDSRPVFRQAVTDVRCCDDVIEFATTGEPPARAVGVGHGDEEIRRVRKMSVAAGDDALNVAQGLRL